MTSAGRPIGIHRARLLAGTCVTAMLLAGSKGASYLGRDPVFLTDFLLIGGLLHFVVTKFKHPDDRTINLRVRHIHPVLIGLFLWSVIRFGMSLQLNTDAIRDFAPYGYAAAGLLSAAALRRSSPEQRQRTAQVLEWALYFHAAWVVFGAIIYPHFYLNLPHIGPGRAEHFFQPRPDIDNATTGIAAGLLVLRALNGRQPKISLIGFALCWISIVSLESRAGQLGAALATGLALSIGLLGRRVRIRRKFVVGVILPLVIGALVFTVPHTHAYSRLLGTFGIGSGDAGAAGTTSARRNSWHRLYEWDTEQAPRSIVGVGFGPDFMTESGALLLLTGSEQGDQPRSPHNYWIGTYSRLGIPGVLLFTVFVLVLAGATIRCRRFIATDPLLAVATLAPTAILIPASFGVVLESPFGAIPFFWAAGVLMSYPLGARFSDPAIDSEADADAPSTTVSDQTL